MGDAGIPALLQLEVKVGLLAKGVIKVCECVHVREDEGEKDCSKRWAGPRQMEPLLDTKFYLLIHKSRPRGLVFYTLTE